MANKGDIKLMKRVVSIQDISCIGKCSQTVALPILSAMGIETSIIPTAILSAHTVFPDFTFRDLSDDIIAIKNHWLSQGITFDGILTGYLGTHKQIEIISDIYDDFRTDDNIIILDPVFADSGKLYTGFDSNYAQALKKLCLKADIIVPNITEAAFLAGVPYKEVHDMEYAAGILDILIGYGIRNVIITSIHIGDKNGLLCHFEDGQTFSHFNTNIDSRFYGTGDIFASTLLGYLVRGNSRKEATILAADYVYETLKATINNPDHKWYGVDFETTLPILFP